MTRWEWFAGNYGDIEYEGIYPSGGFATREEAITELVRIGIEPFEGTALIYVIEARSSTAMKYEGADSVPFVKTRNKQLIDLGELHDSRAESLRRKLAA